MAELFGASLSKEMPTIRHFICIFVSLLEGISSEIYGSIPTILLIIISVPGPKVSARAAESRDAEAKMQMRRARNSGN